MTDPVTLAQDAPTRGERQKLRSVLRQVLAVCEKSESNGLYAKIPIETVKLIQGQIRDVLK